MDKARKLREALKEIDDSAAAGLYTDEEAQRRRKPLIKRLQKVTHLPEADGNAPMDDRTLITLLRMKQVLPHGVEQHPDYDTQPVPSKYVSLASLHGLLSDPVIRKRAEELARDIRSELPNDTSEPAGFNLPAMLFEMVREIVEREGVSIRKACEWLEPKARDLGLAGSAIKNTYNRFKRECPNQAEAITKAVRKREMSRREGTEQATSTTPNPTKSTG